MVLGEVRSKIFVKEVRESWEKLSKVEEMLKEPPCKLMFGFLIHPTAEEEAKAHGIRLIASYMR